MQEAMAVVLDSTPDGVNYYADLIQDQHIAVVSHFQLESGEHLTSVPVAYKTWGKLNQTRDNVLVLCHALSGSSDVEDWWTPLIGRGRAFDTERFFIFCANVLGSPYGSASPVTIDPTTGSPYGPSFPETTFRDDVRIQKLLLDAFGVKQIASVIGGSMGGMLTLEWPLCTPPGYVQSIVPIATSASQSAWGISWSEAQVRCIQADAKYQDGWYTQLPEHQPTQGLGAARMIAMLTYRSCPSFEKRFSRQQVDHNRYKNTLENLKKDNSSDSTSSLESIATRSPTSIKRPKFEAQRYMDYQAEKFLKRFDANCYIHLVRKMDHHDVTRDRVANKSSGLAEDFEQVLSQCPSQALVIGVETDILFTKEQQFQLAEWLPDASHAILDSIDGHDGFLLQFDALGNLITEYLQKHFGRFYEGPRLEVNGCQPVKAKNSVFGEAEVIF